MLFFVEDETIDNGSPYCILITLQSIKNAQGPWGGRGGKGESTLPAGYPCIPLCY